MDTEIKDFKGKGIQLKLIKNEFQYIIKLSIYTKNYQKTFLL